MSLLNISSIILGSLFSKPATEEYPIKGRVFSEHARGGIENRIDSCIYCGICVKKCPTGALTVSRSDKEWTIERFKCIACGACVSACPKKCLDMVNHYTPPSVRKTVDRYSPEKQGENECTNTP